MSTDPISGVAACVFDAYGTLLDVHSAVARAGSTLGSDAQKVSELWRQRQLEYSWLRSLMRSHLDFERVTADALDYALATFRIDDRQLRLGLLQAYRSLDPYPEAETCLRRLKESGLKTAVLSNGSPAMLAAGFESAQLSSLLDAILSVEEVGIFKPALEVYAIATHHFDLPARSIAFLSSNAWDAHGAASFGFRAIWVNRRGAPRERLPGALTAEIDDLSPLPDLVKP